MGLVSKHIKWYNNKAVDKGGTKHLLEEKKL